MGKEDYAMTEINLEPFAAKISLTTTEPIGSDQWSGSVLALLQGIGDGCNSAGSCLVGHVKCLATFDNGEFIRASLVDPARPPELEGRVPDDVKAIDLILNVLVYGMKRSRIATMVRNLLSGPAFVSMSFEVIPLEQTHEHNKSFHINGEPH